MTRLHAARFDRPVGHGAPCHFRTLALSDSRTSRSVMAITFCAFAAAKRQAGSFCDSSLRQGGSTRRCGCSPIIEEGDGT
jgi:hypothetical protein